MVVFSFISTARFGRVVLLLGSNVTVTSSPAAGNDAGDAGGAMVVRFMMVSFRSISLIQYVTCEVRWIINTKRGSNTVYTIVQLEFMMYAIFFVVFVFAEHTIQYTISCRSEVLVGCTWCCTTVCFVEVMESSNVKVHVGYYLMCSTY